VTVLSGGGSGRAPLLTLLTVLTFAADKKKKVAMLNTPVDMLTAVAPRAICASVEYLEEDVCKLMLMAYTRHSVYLLY